MKYNLNRYVQFLSKYKLLFFLALLTVIATDCTSVAEKYLFKKIIDDGTLFLGGTLAKSLFINSLIIVALIFVGIIIVNVTARWFKMDLINILDANLMLDLRIFFFNHIVKLSHHFHTTNKSGSLISRLTRGGHAIESMTDLLIFNITPLIFQLIIVIASIIYFDFTSVIVIAIMVFCFIAFTYVLQRKQQKYQIIANDTEDFEKAKIADFVTNIESIKYFGKENHVQKQYSVISNNTKTTVLDFWGYYRILTYGQSFILGIGTFFIIYFPLLKFLDGNLTIGTLLFIYTVFGTLVIPMYDFSRGMRDFYRVMGDFESLFQYAKIENSVKNKPAAASFKIRTGAIQFKNVFFKYDRRKIFENFSLTISPGKKVALVGHSGCGKSTLIKLLYRLYDIEYGKIMIDQRNIVDVNQESLRSEMSIVPQECVLFDDTVYNNIAFSNPLATKKQVMQAIKFAQLDKIIQTFPEKENTIVGERGIRLSGGEKQRVSIARAILANKKILVLDEATSSLDSQTEFEIQKDLQNLMKNRTSIIIAHRLSTIMKADTIVVMISGKIVQQGKHADLIKVPGEYQKLWRLQKGGYIK